ncbi:hypothetical protein ACC760_38360, partial [Rhizobium ruizarguesonis]
NPKALIIGLTMMPSAQDVSAMAAIVTLAFVVLFVSSICCRQAELFWEAKNKCRCWLGDADPLLSCCSPPC